jgi:hypothetical protein
MQFESDELWLKTCKGVARNRAYSTAICYGWKDSHDSGSRAASCQEGLQGGQDSAQVGRRWPHRFGPQTGRRCQDRVERSGTEQDVGGRRRTGRPETQSRGRAGEGSRQDQLAQRARGDRLPARRRNDPHAGRGTRSAARRRPGSRTGRRRCESRPAERLNL